MTTTSPLDPSTVRAAAQAALDARLGLIDSIVSAQNERTVAAGKVAEAQTAERAAAATELTAIKAALDGGWSTSELRAAGLTVPAAVAKKSAQSASSKNAPKNPRPGRVQLPQRATADGEPAAAGSERRDGESAGDSAASEDLAAAS